MHAGPVVPTPRPLGPFWHLPQRTIQRPGGAPVRRKKQPSGDGSAPQRLVGKFALIDCSVRSSQQPKFERPRNLQGPWPRLLRHRRHVGSIGRPCWIGGRRDLDPPRVGTATVAPDMGAEMAGSERNPTGAAAGHPGSDRVAKKLYVDDFPAVVRSFKGEQTLLRSDHQGVGPERWFGMVGGPHVNRTRCVLRVTHRHPPESACIT